MPPVIRTGQQICSCCDGLGTVASYGVCPLCDGAGCPDDSGDESAEANLWAVAQAVIDGLPDAAELEKAALPCYVNALLGKGMGLFAACSIRPGELILGETPLVTVAGTEELRHCIAQSISDGEGTDTLDMRYVNQICAHDPQFNRNIARALEQLDVSAQEEFLALQDSFCDEMCVGPGVWVEVSHTEHGAPCALCGTYGFIVRRNLNDSGQVVVDVGGLLVNCAQESLKQKCRGTLGGIFLTNAVGDSNSDVSFVYSTSSRINHSCRPNAVVVVRNRVRYIFAAHAIDRGEEICISYIEALCLLHCSGNNSLLNGASGANAQDVHQLQQTLMLR
eukprot:gnl/TRDRNA2_/TRDRNA2_151340_c0_seq8.p1 gnl/TRDRNA2_/TRDRNA2_151340_c0~~gnl/TRDRNA2_/TRDRNA2_151340_c0_seq8.p1  ORF type:complete len:335 (-),score=56.81 gnl/TRDRNA2_/TRDRNA2_151340_c0_seq8:31-1035(-)